MTRDRTVLVAALLAAFAVGGALLVARGRSAPVPQPAVAVAPAATPTAGWLDPRLQAAGAATAGSPLFNQPVSTGFMGHNGRRLDFHGQRAADFIAARTQAAHAGDQRAAYDIYQAESVCATLDDPAPDFLLATEREAFQRERTRLAEVCAGITPAQLQERLTFLAQAAAAGNREAEIDFLMEGPHGKHIDLSSAPADDPDLQQWKAQATGFLRQAAARCDHFALGLLANAYDAGQLVAPDQRLVLAYSMAQAAARGKPLTDQQLQDRFGSALSPADFAQARRTGAQLTAQNCPGR